MRTVVLALRARPGHRISPRWLELVEVFLSVYPHLLLPQPCQTLYPSKQTYLVYWTICIFSFTSTVEPQAQCDSTGTHVMLCNYLPRPRLTQKASHDLYCNLNLTQDLDHLPEPD